MELLFVLLESWSWRLSRSWVDDRPIPWNVGYCRDIVIVQGPWEPVLSFTILFAVFTASSV